MATETPTCACGRRRGHAPWSEVFLRTNLLVDCPLARLCGLRAAGCGLASYGTEDEFRAVLSDGVWGLREHICKKLEGRAVTPTLYAAAHAKPPPGEGSLNPLLHAEDSRQYECMSEEKPKLVVGWYEEARMISYRNNKRNGPVGQVDLCWSGNKKPSCAKVSPSACCAPTRGYSHG